VFIKKLFGKKNDGFYLQLEDDDKAPTPVAKPKAESKPVAVVEVAPVMTPPTAVVEAVPAAKAEPATKSAAKAELTAAKAEKKAEKKSIKKTTENKVEATPAPIAASVPVAPPITNFATDYLIKPSSTSTRRRPGANMNAYLDMARQATKQAPFKK
jgi:type IV secretory pathway VirB10-like protein